MFRNLLKKQKLTTNAEYHQNQVASQVEVVN